MGNPRQPAGRGQAASCARFRTESTPNSDAAGGAPLGPPPYADLGQVLEGAVVSERVLEFYPLLVPPFKRERHARAALERRDAVLLVRAVEERLVLRRPRAVHHAVALVLERRARVRAVGREHQQHRHRRLRVDVPAERVGRLVVLQQLDRARRQPIRVQPPPRRIRISLERQAPEARKEPRPA